MESIIKEIEQANEIQLNEIISAVINRYNVLRADREGVFLSLPTDPYTRKEELEKTILFLRACYDKQNFC